MEITYLSLQRTLSEAERGWGREKRGWEGVGGREEGGREGGGLGYYVDLSFYVLR